jgi:hypothetical protein
MLIDCMKRNPDPTTFRVVERRLNRVGFGETYTIIDFARDRLSALGLATAMNMLAPPDRRYTIQSEGVGNHHIERAFNITL